MKTLTKLTLTTVAAMTLGATTLLAGPGPFTRQIYTAPRHLPPTAPMTCKRMIVNQGPRHGGTAVVACTKAIKDTLACRVACR